MNISVHEYELGKPNTSSGGLDSVVTDGRNHVVVRLNVSCGKNNMKILKPYIAVGVESERFLPAFNRKFLFTPPFVSMP